MSGTNAAAAKARLVELLGPLLPDLHVDYSYVGKHHEVEYVYLGGRFAGPMELAAMKGSGRIRRREDITGSVHILVRTPGEETAEAAETRAAEIGRVLEELLAGDVTLGGLSDLKSAVISNVAMESGVDDDAASAELTYQITFLSMPE